MLRTAQLLPQKGFRRWASTRPVSRPSRQPATGPPGSYPDGTHTRWRRRASVGSGQPINHPQRLAHEKEHKEAAQPKSYDREEVTLDDACCLLMEEFAPAQARSAGDRVDAVAAEDVPDGARRAREAEHGQFAVDALVAPARILGRQPQHELARLRDHRQPARRVSGEAPASAHKLAMPAKKRRRLDEQRTHAR